MQFGKRPPPAEGSPASDKPDELGCSPYIQIFKAGNLVFTTAAAMSYSQNENDLPFCCPSDGPISFNVETIVQGDILIRCRHLTRKGQRISMFRAAFHTGYIPPKVMRLSKTQLDGACSDRRYAVDFFLDLIFEACDAEMASKHLLNAPKEEEEAHVTAMAEETAQNEAAARRQRGTVTGAAANVSASAYDTMLHRDSRFWEVIAERRRENTKKMASAGAIEGDDEDALEKKYCGPTIGRRRDLQTEKVGKKDDEDVSGNEGKSDQPSREEKKAIEAFSIGGEFDFLGGDDDDDNDDAVTDGSTNMQHDHTIQEEEPPSPPKKDDLMDALMALDEDEEIDTPSPVATRKKELAVDEAGQTTIEATVVETEEVVFDHADKASADKIQLPGVVADLPRQEDVSLPAEPQTNAEESEASTTPAAVTAAAIQVLPTAITEPVSAALFPPSKPTPAPKADVATAEGVSISDKSTDAVSAAATIEATTTVSTDGSPRNALADLGVDLPDLDDDLEAMETTAQGAVDTSAFDDDDFDFDDDDDELNDLEAFLSKNT